MMLKQQGGRGTDENAESTYEYTVQDFSFEFTSYTQGADLKRVQKGSFEPELNELTALMVLPSSFFLR